MKLIRLGTLVLFICCSGIAAAETDKTKIDQTVARFQSFEVISGNFSQEKKLAGVNKLLRSSGTFIFWRNQGLWLNTEKPFHNAITIAKEQLIHWDKNGKGQQVKDNSSLVQREINKTLLAFFGADVDLIQERFDLAWTFEADGRWQATLTPKLDAIKRYMSLVVIEGEQYLKRITVSFGEEDQTVIQFSDQQQTDNIDQQQCRWFYFPLDNHCQ